MSWLLLVLVVLVLGGAFTERSQHPRAERIRSSRPYRAGRVRIVNAGKSVIGRPVVYRNGKATPPKPKVLGERNRPSGRTEQPPPRAPRPPRPRSLPYVKPDLTVNESNGSGPKTQPGLTVDFFSAIMRVAHMPYEGPNDALRILRTFHEGTNNWVSGMTMLHQRMSDPGDMNIDPYVAEHLIQATAYLQAARLSLAEADAAFTVLLNMTVAELVDRGMRIPNTRF
jgi:hypothetical protein